MQLSARHTLARWGAVGAIASSIAFVFTLVYVFGLLAALGLSEEMLDTPAQLLPWVADHAQRYGALYWIFLFSTLALLPAPLALYGWLKEAAPALISLGTVAGLIGITIGMTGPLVNLAGTAILARAYVAPATNAHELLLVLSEMVGELGLLLRLTADLFLGIWLGLIGLTMVRHTVGSRWFGGYTLFLALFILIVVIGKALTLLDLEPVLGLFLAIAYGWLGWLLFTKASGVRSAME